MKIYFKKIQLYEIARFDGAICQSILLDNKISAAGGQFEHLFSIHRN